MRVIKGFVTNSSSSSFIVVSKATDKEKKSKNGLSLSGQEFLNECYSDGEFGWSYHEYYSFYDKVIFSWLQARYMCDLCDGKYTAWKEKPKPETGKEWMAMLTEVLAERNIRFETEYFEKLYQGNDIYIDHQSTSYEFSNTEMFDSKEDLINFLFSGQSYIRTQNDNE